MENFYIEEGMADGTTSHIEFDNCAELVHWIVGFDVEPPVTEFQMQARTDDGRTVRIIVPNDDSRRVQVVIEEMAPH